MRSASKLHLLYVVLFMLFMLAPLAVVVGASFEPQELLRFPPGGLSLRWYRAAIVDSTFVAAAYNSLVIGIAATAGSLLLGVPAAYGLARRAAPATSLLAGLLNAPLLVPELAIGVALLLVIGWLRLPASFITVALGHVLICLPYVVRTSYAAMQGIDVTLEEAALTLGASQLRVQVTILLPLIRPALYTGTLFAFLLSFDNAVISLFLVSPRSTTLPIAIYSNVQFSLNPTIAAVSTLLMAVSILAMVLANRLGPLDRLGP